MKRTIPDKLHCLIKVSSATGLSL